jgi:NDP-sugar pyrophosphorylase family protein
MKKNLFPVVILAGGLATRLRPITESIPKALIPINGKPFIDHQLRLVARQGIHKVVLCVGYLGEMIEEHVGNGHKFGLEVHYSYDGQHLLGTAGTIKQALPLLNAAFFVLNGDSYLNCDYSAVQASFVAAGKQGLMTVFHNQSLWDKSNVEYAAGKILVYDKHTHSEHMHHIDYGLSLFSQEAFDHVPRGEASDLALLNQRLLKEDQLAAHEVKERFYEVGSFSGIKDFEEYLFAGA